MEWPSGFEGNAHPPAEWVDIGRLSTTARNLGSEPQSLKIVTWSHFLGRLVGSGSSKQDPRRLSLIILPPHSEDWPIRSFPHVAPLGRRCFPRKEPAWTGGSFGGTSQCTFQLRLKGHRREHPRWPFGCIVWLAALKGTQLGPTSPTSATSFGLKTISRPRLSGTLGRSGPRDRRDPHGIPSDPSMQTGAAKCITSCPGLLYGHFVLLRPNLWAPSLFGKSRFNQGFA